MDTIRCIRCGDPIEPYEVELTDVSLRRLWYSRTEPRLGNRGIQSGLLTTMCGLGVSEEIPPDQLHRPGSITTGSPAGGPTSDNPSTAEHAEKRSRWERLGDTALSFGELPNDKPEVPGSA